MLAKDLKLDYEEIHIVLYGLVLWRSIMQPFDNTAAANNKYEDRKRG